MIIYFKALALPHLLAAEIYPCDALTSHNRYLLIVAHVHLNTIHKKTHNKT